MNKPNLLPLLAIMLVSAAALAYEVLLMRLFAIIQWHHFAYMIISLALLGYGVSGAFLTLATKRFRQNYSSVVFGNIVLFCFAAPACFMLAQALPFNPVELLWTSGQLLYLALLYLLMAIPFFFAANVIGLSYLQFSQQINRVYAADLTGASLGSLGIITLLNLLRPEHIFLVLIAMGSVSAILIAGQNWQTIKKHHLVWLVILIPVAIALTASLKLTISPYKSLPQFLQIPGTEIIAQYSSPLGKVDVVKSNKTPIRHAPGLSLNATTEPPEQLAVFTDADNMTAITRYNGHSNTHSYLDQTTSALPFHIRPLANVLILGAGTGSDILQANYHQIKQIDAIELNPQIIDLIKNKFADFAGHLYTDDRISIHQSDIRGYLAATLASYDLINLSLLDAFGSSAAGLYALNENYLFTEQAIESYQQHLRPNGYLSITRWTKIPPRDELKLLTTVISALKQGHTDQPALSLIMIRGWQTSTLLVKKGLITTDEINNLKQFCSQRNFDLVFYPGITETEVNRFNVQEQPYLYQAMTALLSDKHSTATFIADYKFDIEPVTDDKPYLQHFFKWQSLPEILSLLDTGGISLLESSYLLLLATLLQAALASLILIGLPIWIVKRKTLKVSNSRRLFATFTYFFCLGLAFLFIEMAFIQKFTLILHHPIYAVTLVLSTFLLSAGLGSYSSQKHMQPIQIWQLIKPITLISIFGIFYGLGFESIAAVLLQSGSSLRYLLSICLIAPLGFYMGKPFPLGLAILGNSNRELIPWAWGINGCVSVISALLATLIAMHFGFTLLIFAAIGLYLIAALSLPLLSSNSC